VARAPHAEGANARSPPKRDARIEVGPRGGIVMVLPVVSSTPPPLRSLVWHLIALTLLN
jgi:hypothetical protein